MRAVFLLVALAAGCYSDGVRHCPTVDCPAEMVCDGKGGCAFKEQIDQCAGVPEGTACSYPNVSDGECKEQLCLPAGCGNGVITGAEVCDDSNTNNGDGCSADCRSLEVCGNNIVDPAKGEECDGGVNCRADCTQKRCGDGIIDAPFEACDDGEDNDDALPDACRLNCQTSRCGDGITDSNEQCDDGGNASGDGCSANCLIEECGNGIIESNEECDDGNTNSDTLPNACRSDCTRARCGDGVTDAPVESCDDGDDDNANAPDKCRLNCQLPRCGDSIVDTLEVCDIGDTNSGDGCSADCRSDESCGNGTVDPGEQCDNGPANLLEADKCRPGTCELPRCGDGVKDTLEACDNGDNNNDNVADACRTNCQLHRCGDGVQDSDEVCDDGNNASGDGCSADCKSQEECGDGILNIGTETCDCGFGPVGAPPNCGGLQNSDANSNAPCRQDCTLRRCGDGILEQPEQCESGVAVTTTCQDVGFYNGGALGCSDFCTFDSGACSGKCGDSLVQAANGEQCDKLNLNGASCTTLGFQQGTLACSNGCLFNTSNCTGFCGDNQKNGPVEQCDGPDFGGASCQTLGFYTGALSCTAACNLFTGGCSGFCGDGVAQNGFEACDKTDLNGKTCANVDPEKFVGTGLLTCDPRCGFDTGKCARVRDGKCDFAIGENCTNSPDDCGGTFCCGNGECKGAETPENCPADCLPVQT